MIEDCFVNIWCKHFKDLMENIFLHPEFYEIYLEGDQGK